jgi:signal transduction histidine kinase/CheY-like chemotaxis protein/HAMP domain-containing protein
MHTRINSASWSIRKKLLLCIVAIFLPIFGFIVTSGLKDRRKTIETAENNSLLLVHSLAAQQEKVAIGTKQMLSTLAKLPMVQKLDAAACNDFFRELHKLYPFYSNISAVTPDGNMFASSPFQPGSVNLADRKHFKDAVATGDFSAGEFIVGRISNVPSINYAYPVFDANGKLIAVVIAGFKLNEYSSFIAKAKLPKETALTITDYKGVRLFRNPENDAAGPGKAISEASFRLVSGDMEQGLYESSGGDGIRRFYAFTQLRLKENSPPYLYMIVGIPKDAVMHQADIAMLGNLLFLGILAFLEIALLWVLGNYIFIRPIGRLVVASQHLGKGELESRTGLLHADDELGQLAKSFDDMASQLQMREKERQHAQEHLERSISLLNGTLESTADGILVVNNAGNVVSYNRKFAELWRIDAKVLQSHDDDTYITSIQQHLKDPDEFLERIRKIYAQPEAESFDTVEFLDGRIFERYSQPHYIGGDILGRVWSFRDVTQRRRVEKEKENLRAQLLQAQKMESIGRLAGGVAHDFNNMLSVIIGYTQIALEETEPSSALHSNLQQVLKAGQRSAEITRQLLAFARKQSIAPKLLNLNETIEQGMLQMLRRLIGEHIDLAWKPKTKLWTVKIDSTQLDQLLINLCINARDALTGTGKITIETDKVVLDELFCTHHTGAIPGEYVLLSVSDNGCGMDKEILANIFEPFFTTKEIGQGTGLGLATVYGIVKQNNGFIYVESAPAQGTTFSIYLPRQRDQLEQLQLDTATIPAAGKGHATILLVEDEQMILDMATDILQLQGYTVLATTSPTEALSLAEQHAGEIHLLITDVIMPEMNGRELADRLHSLCPEVKPLFMSGYTADIIAHHGIVEEDDILLPKPFSSKDLIAMVANILACKPPESVNMGS